MLVAFLHSPAVENNKGEGKEAEEEGVFFWFGDDLAVDDNLHRIRKIGETTKKLQMGLV